MKKYLKPFVTEDTPEAWAKVKGQMPWNFKTAGSEKLAGLDFSDCDIDISDAKAIDELISESPKGTIWGAFYLDPYITLGNDFYPYIRNCQQLVMLEQVPGLSSLEAIYMSKRPWSEGLPQDAISFLLIVCPRCQLIATDGDEEADFEPDEDESFVDENCPACDGTGEWDFELF
jgi:hypothetical protein